MFTVKVCQPEVGWPVTESARHCTDTDGCHDDGTVLLQVATPMAFAVTCCWSMLVLFWLTKNETVPLASAVPTVQVKVTLLPTVAGLGLMLSDGLMVTQLWLLHT